MTGLRSRGRRCSGPKSAQAKTFMEAARAAEADESETAFEARLKAVAQHQPPLAKIGVPKKPRRAAKGDR